MEVVTRALGHEQGHERGRVSKLLLHKGYMKLEPSGSVEQELPPTNPPTKRSGSVTSKQHQQHQRRKLRFRVRPKVRVLYSTIFTLGRRLRDSYSKVMLALAAKVRDKSVVPALGSSKKQPGTTGIRNGSMFRFGSRRGLGCGCDLSDVETKYLEYVKRSITDGELAYYTMSFRTTGIL